MTKKQLLYSCLFVIIAGIIICVLTFSIEHKVKTYRGNDALGKINGIMNHELDPELSIWGASTAWVHFDASLIETKTGVSTFNMGLNGTFYDQYRGLLNHFIHSSKKAKYIVIALNIQELAKKEQLYRPQNFYHYLNDPYINETFSTFDRKKVLSMHIPSYILTTYDLEFYQKILSKETSSPDDIKGFHPNDLQWINSHNTSTKDIEIDSLNLMYLQKTIQYSKKNQITPIICITPFYCETEQAISTFTKELELLNQFAITNDVILLNYLTSPLSLNKSLFYNHLHMNSKGAELLTNAFITDFKTSFKTIK